MRIMHICLYLVCTLERRNFLYNSINIAWMNIRVCSAIVRGDNTARATRRPPVTISTSAGHHQKNTITAASSPHISPDVAVYFKQTTIAVDWDCLSKRKEPHLVFTSIQRKLYNPRFSHLQPKCPPPHPTQAELPPAQVSIIHTLFLSNEYGKLKR